MDYAKVANRFVDWWKSGKHRFRTKFHGAEYSLARQAFVLGFISYTGEEDTEQQTLIREQLEDAIHEEILQRGYYETIPGIQHHVW